jgi:hypothetical protein
VAAALARSDAQAVRLMRVRANVQKYRYSAAFTLRPSRALTLNWAGLLWQHLQAVAENTTQARILSHAPDCYLITVMYRSLLPLAMATIEGNETRTSQMHQLGCSLYHVDLRYATNLLRMSS